MGSVEAEIRRPDGTRRQLDAQCSRTPEGFILSVRDISDTVEMLRRVEIAASHDMLDPPAQQAQLRDRAT